MKRRGLITCLLSAAVAMTSIGAVPVSAMQTETSGAQERQTDAAAQAEKLRPSAENSGAAGTEVSGQSDPENTVGNEQPENPEKNQAETKKTGGKWERKNKNVYYRLDHKNLTGLQKAGKRQYYFSKKGIQRVGWQEIDGKYYYFQIYPGKKGFMVTKSVVNHIRLTADGSARVTADNRKRLQVLVKAQRVAQRYTKLGMSRPERLRSAWKQFQKDYRYLGSPVFHKTRHWEVDYAYAVFRDKKGSCYDLGATWAFLANACGVRDACAVSSGGHGWAEINGYVFDPAWAREDRRHNYYHMNMALSGRDGRPNYRAHRTYIKKV